MKILFNPYSLNRKIMKKHIIYTSLALTTLLSTSGFAGTGGGKELRCPATIQVSSFQTDPALSNLDIYRERLCNGETIVSDGNTYTLETFKFHSPVRGLNLTLGKTLTDTHILTAALEGEPTPNTCKYIKRWQLPSGEKLEFDVVIKK